ncbi:hypothetical protein [Shimwellia blattae]|uniref:Lipoprotein n=1 Tax=Shimwellia blattae (strain ATCC 29907 / DSM 4481 / JCM 1650 / NBRC 105725 / CDC 9005-74) TaxID=630626 RepID=I2B8G7_SHIBC|nr:hypothetical protein [Shimwellia blattae]AFJ46821.1 hypothetical protein EBL_c17270 [Shimwellia blattae DSM 4481 = NBRC 105725]GAB82961.1 hypothetical protein EB105725_38_00090 [Shimwellia blattae DSM 4481 = NBRC 105725]VDY64300.1 Uncharacterised protein [Shimwellia blattae]VEC22425.1 Uncharacterised protein [Shimwellia blattae]
MKPVIPVIGLMLLTGCGSASHLRGQEPVLEGSSPKSPAALAQCVQEQWARSGVKSELTTSGTGSSVLVPGTLGGYRVLLDARPSSQGSDFSLYERLAHVTSVVYEDGVAFCK